MKLRPTRGDRGRTLGLGVSLHWANRWIETDDRYRHKESCRGSKCSHERERASWASSSATARSPQYRLSAPTSRGCSSAQNAANSDSHSTE